MAQGKITKTAVDGLAKREKDYFLWDEDLAGFGVKVTATGKRIYVFQYRLGGREAKTRRWTIGPHGSPWGPPTARKEAERLGMLVRQGIDPVAAEEARRRDAIDLDFKSYAETFIKEYLAVTWKDGGVMPAGYLRREAVPAFKGKSLKDIKRSDISAFVARFADRPTARRNAYAALRKLFRWAVNRGDIEESPVRDLEAPPTPPSRDRVLSTEELVCIWLAAEKRGFPYGTMVQLFVLTGQRRSEISKLDWKELDRKAALWTLPQARAKNAKAHTVPLSPAAIKLFDKLAARSRKDGNWPAAGLIFSHDGEKSVAGFSAAKQQVDKLVSPIALERGTKQGHMPEHSVVAHWTFHDLRRTLATGMQQLNVRFEVTESILNHKGSKSGIVGVYQRHEWADEKRAALNAWATQLEHEVAGTEPASNVVPLAAARA